MIEYITRSTWGMPGNLGPVKVGPFDGVDLHHVGSLDTGGDPIRDLYHAAAFTSGKFGRVSYNGGIDMDSIRRLLEMQGMRIGAHNDAENSKRWGLVVAGNFEEQDAPDELIEAIADSVLLLYSRGEIRRAHIKGHRDSDATACPGIKLYRRLPEVREIIKEKQNMARTEPASWAREAVEDLRREGVLSDDGDLDSAVTEERFAVFLHRAKQKGYFGSGGGGLTVAQVHAIIRSTGLEPGKH